MTTTQDPPANATRAAQWRWLRDRSELGFAAGILAIAVFLTINTITMEVPDGSGTPGPQFFPTIIAGFLYVTGAMLAVSVIRHPRERGPGAASSSISTDMLEDLGQLDNTGELRIVRAGPPKEAASAELTDADGDGEAPVVEAPTPIGSEYVPVDYRTVGIILGGLIAFVVLLQPVGWLITSAGLFWVVCYALGSKRPVFDIWVALIAASLIQLAFSAALGLQLPAGIMEGLL